VKASVQAVDSSVSKVQQGVSDVNSEMKNVDAKANASDDMAAQQLQAKEDLEKLQNQLGEVESQHASALERVSILEE
jgi:archaellum component FlaC